MRQMPGSGDDSPAHRPNFPVTDAYGLDPDRDWEGVEPCANDEHNWGPWVLSPVYSNREDRFCTACGVMEMQWIEA